MSPLPPRLELNHGLIKTVDTVKKEKNILNNIKGTEEKNKK